MKNIASDSPLIVSEGLESSIMGIDPANAARITKYLRDSIYSDKVLATVRETLMNSLDEHLQHNVSKAVEVGIREEESGPEFYSRDFALGLSEKDVREVFGMYGSSTKRTSNTPAGMFGIGSLAPFSYSDSFFVVSRFQGIKTTYSCALGGDAQNVSVGHIFKVDECPTNESGLEVIVPVQHRDITDFSNKIRNFVLCSPYKVKADILGIEFEPRIPTYEKKVNDYNFRLIECEYQHNQKTLFQMGGNTYQIDSFVGPNGEKIKKDHCLIIDIPIGHCSITLSREAFEKTEKNSKVFAEIEGVLNTLVDEDLAQFKTKNTLELVNDSLAQMKSYAGNMFQASASQIYKNVWGFVSNVSKANDAGPIQYNKLGQPICVVIPNNDARNYWKQKVRGFLSDVQQNMYVITEGYDWNQSNPEITNQFSIVSARKLPYPKTTKDSGRFTVYRRERRRRRVESVGKFNALEFFNHASKENQWGFEAKTEKEASDFLAKKEKEIKNISDLELMIVKPNKDGNSCYWGVNSVVFFDKLEALGFIGLYSQKYKDIYSKIKEREEKKNQIASTISNAKKAWIVYGPKTSKAIEKVEKAQKINKFWSVVLSETTLRAKILRKFQERCYGDSSKLERSELRKILKLV